VNQKIFVRVLLGLLAVLLVAGMVYQFTPALSGLRTSKGTPALKVNGQVVDAADLDRVRQSNPILSMTQEGVLGEDFKTVAVDQKVREVLLGQAAKDVKISRKEVDEQVREIREQNNLTKTKDWVGRLAQIGFTDASFRESIRTRLAIQKKAEAIQNAAPKPTEAEAKTYYELNSEAFRSDPRIVGRVIAVKEEKLARDLLKQIKTGADFAKLASQHSLEHKDRGGALAAPKDGKIPPVGALALPQEASAAAFELTDGGVTDVVKSNDKFYIVKVEQFVPAGTKPWTEAKNDAMKAVEQSKQNAAIEAWLEGLEKDAKIEVLDKSWSYYNPTVAEVNGQKIPYAQLLMTMVSNQQLGALLQQGGDQAVGFVNGFFKPQVLDSLVQQYAAPVIVKKLKLPLTGSRQELLTGLQAYGGRDVKVTEAQVRGYYEQQKPNFQTPASAVVSEAVFKDRQKALAFRGAFVKAGGDFTNAASKAGGTVSERGSVTGGDQKLSEVAEKAVFQADRLTPAGEGSVTDVVESGERFSVLFVKDLVKASTKPLSEVRDQIREQLETQLRSEAGQKFVQEQLKSVKVENKLESVLKEVEKRAKANAPKTDAPKQPDTTKEPETDKAPEGGKTDDGTKTDQ